GASNFYEQAFLLPSDRRFSEARLERTPENHPRGEQGRGARGPIILRDIYRQRSGAELDDADRTGLSAEPERGHNQATCNLDHSYRTSLFDPIGIRQLQPLRMETGRIAVRS